MTEFEQGDVLRIRGDVYQVKAVDPRATIGGGEYKQYRLVHPVVEKSEEEVLEQRTAANLQPRHRDDQYECTLVEVTGITEDEVEVVG